MIGLVAGGRRAGFPRNTLFSTFTLPSTFTWFPKLV
jgi:hypothetical protein